MGTAGERSNGGSRDGGLGIVQDPRDHCKYFVFYLSETIWATEGFKQRSDVVWLIF